VSAVPGVSVLTYSIDFTLTHAEAHAISANLLTTTGAFAGKSS
jgi:hypothetical protein